MILDPPSTLYGGDGTEPVLGCFVTGTDSAKMSYIVVRAVPALADGPVSKKRARSKAGGAFVGDMMTTKSGACERLAAIALAHAHDGEARGDEHDFNFATVGQNAVNLGAHLRAVLHSRNTVGGVSWLPAKLFDELGEKARHGRGCRSSHGRRSSTTTRTKSSSRGTRFGSTRSSAICSAS
jgi:hypothetical protein